MPNSKPFLGTHSPPKSTMSSVSLFSHSLRSLKGTSKCGADVGTGPSASHAGVAVSPRPPSSWVLQAAGSTGAVRPRCCGCGRGQERGLAAGAGLVHAAHLKSAWSQSLRQVHARQSFPPSAQCWAPGARASVHFFYPECGQSRLVRKSGDWGLVQVCVHPHAEPHLLTAEADASPAPVSCFSTLAPGPYAPGSFPQLMTDGR